NEEIASCRKIFAEVQVAGNRLLDEVSPYMALVAKQVGGAQLKDCGLNEHGYPKSFDPRLALQSSRRRITGRSPHAAPHSPPYRSTPISCSTSQRASRSTGASQRREDYLDSL